MCMALGREHRTGLQAEWLVGVCDLFLSVIMYNVIRIGWSILVDRATNKVITIKQCLNVTLILFFLNIYFIFNLFREQF